MATLIPITIKLNTDDANKSLTTFESKFQSVFATQKFNVPIGFDSTTLKFKLEETETIARQSAHQIQENFKSVETLNFSQPVKQLGDMKTLVLSMDNSRVTEMRTLVRGVGTEAQKATEAFSSNNSQVTELRTLVRAVGTEAKQTAEGGVRDIGKKIEESVADFDKLKTVGTALEDFGSKINGIGQSLTSGLTEPLTGLAEKIVSSGITYEHSLNSFQDSTKATAEEMAQASAVALQLSTDVSLPATSAVQAAEAMDGLGKAGFTAAQSMAAAKDIIILAAAGQIEQAKAAEIAGGAINSFNLKAEDSSRVIDLFAGASKASGAEITDLAATFAKSSSSFANAKVPIEDFTTAVTIMANAGLTGGDAGKSLNAFLSSIQAPSKEGAAAMKSLGVEIFNAGGKMKSLPDIIGQFNTSLTGLTDQGKVDAIKKIFGADASQAAQALFKDGVAGFEKIKEAVTETGAASELAAAKTKGVGGAFDLLKTRAETIGTVIYAAVKDKAEEALIKLANLVGNVADYLGNLSKNNPELIQIGVVFLGIVAAIGPVVAVLGSVIAFLGPIVSGLGTVAGALAAAGSTTALLTAGFTAISTFVTATLIPALVTIAPVVLAVGTVVAGLAVAAVAIYEAWETNFGNIQGIVTVFKEQVTEAFNGLLSVVQPAINEVSDYATDGFNKISEWWKTDGKEIKQAATTVLAGLASAVQSILDEIKEFWAANGQVITNLVSSSWDSVKTIINSAMRIVGSTILLISQAINGNWTGFWDTFQDIVHTAIKGVNAFLEGSGTLLLAALQSMLAAAFTATVYVYEKSVEIGTNIIRGIVNGITNGHGLVRSAISHLTFGATDVAMDTLGIQSPSRVFQEIGEFTVQGFINGIQNKIPAAKEASAKLAGEITKQF